MREYLATSKREALQYSKQGVKVRQCDSPQEQKNLRQQGLKQSAMTGTVRNFKTAPTFTLAEVLLTLAVIGIVAAITLPALMVDTTEKAFDAQRKALHARLAQAIGTMANLSGYGEYTPDASTPKDTAAETFLYEGLSKVYKMNNICGYDTDSTTSASVLKKCNIPSKITTMNGVEKDFPTNLSSLNSALINTLWGVDSDKSTTNTKVAAFETINGESVAVFYNPNCKSNIEVGPNKSTVGDYFYTQNRMCANFIYDLNGLKGPNKVGKDIGFITALYDKNPEVVAPMPFPADVDTTTHTQQAAVDECAEYSDDSRLPNKHELTSLFYNKDLVGGFRAVGYWSSSVISSSRGWAHNFIVGNRYRLSRSLAYYVRCVRK